MKLSTAYAFLIRRTVSARNKTPRIYDQGLKIGVGLGRYEMALHELTRYDVTSTVTTTTTTMITNL